MATSLPVLTGDTDARVGVDYTVMPTGTYATVTRAVVTVGTAPVGGTTVVRIGNATGGGGDGISVTISAGTNIGTATGSVLISGGAVYLRVTSSAGTTISADLSGYIETELDTSETTLTTLAKVKAYLGITVTTHDSLLTELVQAATKTAQGEIGRDLYQTSYIDEPLSGDGFTDVLMVRHYPISQYPTATVLYDADLNVIPVADYEIEKDGDTGILRKVSGAWEKGTNNYLIDYTGGYATVPADLSVAVTTLAAHLFTQTQAGGGRLGISGTAGLAGDSSTYLTDALLSQVERTFARYRRLI